MRPSHCKSQLVRHCPNYIGQLYSRGHDLTAMTNMPDHKFSRNQHGAVEELRPLADLRFDAALEDESERRLAGEADGILVGT